MPEKAKEIFREFKSADVVSTYSQQGAIGKRYRQQDEIGTPYCITVDGDTAADGTVTLRDRDTLVQDRVPVDEVVDIVLRLLRTA
jgi:glycyl-tRNA synthetase